MLLDWQEEEINIVLFGLGEGEPGGAGSVSSEFHRRGEKRAAGLLPSPLPWEFSTLTVASVAGVSAQLPVNTPLPQTGLMLTTAIFGG